MKAKNGFFDGYECVGDIPAEAKIFDGEHIEYVDGLLGHILLNGVKGELLNIVESIGLPDKQETAIKRMVINILHETRHHAVEELRLLKNNPKANGKIRPLAKWQNKVITGSQKRLWVEVDRGVGKTTTAQMASLLRHTLVVANWPEDAPEFKIWGIDYVAANQLLGHGFSKYEQIILDDVITCDLQDVLKAYTGRIVVFSTNKEEYSPDYIAPLPLTDDWVFIKA
jgi:hypothetical protein